MLLGSLREHECHASNHNTYELFVIVPDEHIFATRALETSDKCAVIRIVEESSLLDGIIKETWHAYALQMALKLLVAQYVTTSHYITLDSDIVLVGMINLTKLLPGGRGVFEEEPRNIHPHWWQSSAALLGLPEDAFPNARFGVTPAILSTAGSAITTTLIRDRFKDVDWQEVWLRSWGSSSWWSEYTVYRLSLDSRGLFGQFHTIPISRTLCEPVWHQSGLPWDVSKAFDDLDCIFSLVQSTTHLAPSSIAADVSAQIQLGKAKLLAGGALMAIEA